MKIDILILGIQDGIQCNSNDWHIGGDEVRLALHRSLLGSTDHPCYSSPTTARTSVVLRALRPTRIEAIRRACDRMGIKKVFTVLASQFLIQ